jgi:hypothetical protein
MQRLGNISFEQELNGNKIHSLSNVLTLGADVHAAFDRLKIFLDPIDGVRVILFLTIWYSATDLDPGP